MLGQRATVIETIFVVGFPRSGTTWFSNLINSHPDAVYRHEVFGREYKAFGDDLFKALKFNDGLTDAEHEQALKVLLSARISTDKPPFFRKKYHRISNVDLQRLSWLAAQAAPFLEPLYTYLFTPKAKSEVTLVIKETRSSVNLASIVAGVRTSNLLVLVRHPYAVISSHLKGRESGLMGGGDEAHRKQWMRANKDAAYLLESGVSEEAVLDMQEVEFLALNWRVQNEDYLNMLTQNPNSQLLIYEEFLSDPQAKTKQLFSSLGLQMDPQVEAFVNESSSKDVKKNLLTKDSSSEYFSVYRGKSFDPDKWKKILTPDDVELVDKHTLLLTEKLGLNKWIEKGA